MARRSRFARLIADAVAYFAEHGYSDQAVLNEWLRRLRIAAQAEEISDLDMYGMLRRHMGGIFDRTTSDSYVKQYAGGVGRFTVERIKPALRAELDKRIHTSVDLIKLNRAEATEKTLRRFAGWTTSVPDGGATDAQRKGVVAEIAKPTREMKYIARRVAIDQGHKLAADVSHMIAMENAAIAAEWHSHWRRPGYQYREEHKERDGRVYAIRGSWAMKRGLMKAGAAGYLDDITQPGQEVNCTCYVRYISNISGLPEDMLTKKGKEALA